MNALLPDIRRMNGVPVPQLATLRRQAGISQRTLATQAGLSMQTVSRLEHGANARYDTIHLLAQALHVSPSRLIRHHQARTVETIENPSKR